MFLKPSSSSCKSDGEQCSFSATQTLATNYNKASFDKRKEDLCFKTNNLLSSVSQTSEKIEKLKPTFSQKKLMRDFFKACVKFKSITSSFRDVMDRLLDCWTTKGCFPSHADIAAETGLSDRTVRNVLREAELRGWISWTNRRIGRRQTSNNYVFHLKNKMMQTVLGGISKMKQKTAEIRNLFRRKNIPPSAYFYLNRKRISMNSAFKRVKKKLWDEITGILTISRDPKEVFTEKNTEKKGISERVFQGESAWQRLFRENPSEAIKILKNNENL